MKIFKVILFSVYYLMICKRNTVNCNFFGESTHHYHQRYEYPTVHKGTLQMYSPEAGDQRKILLGNRV